MSTGDDSDSDSGSVENSRSDASERTPLLASVAISASASARGTSLFVVAHLTLAVGAVIAYTTNFDVSISIMSGGA